MSSGIALGLVIIAVFLVVKCIIVVPEGTVLKTFRLGKPYKSFGAGVHIGWFDLLKKIKLSIGTIGKATSESTLEVDGHSIEVKFSELPRIGSPARIDRFDGMEPIVTQRNVPNERVVKCEKCGHHNNVLV